MIEKLKRKNIEKKMLERVQLKSKILKIKELEIFKKMQYYLDKKVRQFIKETKHEESKNDNCHLLLKIRISSHTKHSKR